MVCRVSLCCFPLDCLNHEAVHLVSKACYSKQKCVVAVSNKTFRDPCFPGTRKYLNVVYSCGRTPSASSFIGHKGFKYIGMGVGGLHDIDYSSHVCCSYIYLLVSKHFYLLISVISLSDHTRQHSSSED